jgi:hypothetical protein
MRQAYGARGNGTCCMVHGGSAKKDVTTMVSKGELGHGRPPRLTWDGLQIGHSGDELRRLNGRGGRRGHPSCSILMQHEQ